MRPAPLVVTTMRDMVSSQARPKKHEKREATGLVAWGAFPGDASFSPQWWFLKEVTTERVRETSQYLLP